MPPVALDKPFNDQLAQLNEIDLSVVCQGVEKVMQELEVPMATEREVLSGTMDASGLSDKLEEIHRSLAELPNALIALQSFYNALVDYSTAVEEHSKDRANNLVKNQLLPAMKAVANHMIMNVIKADAPQSVGIDGLLEIAKNASELGEAAEFLLSEFIKDGMQFGKDAVDEFASGNKTKIDNYLEQYAYWLIGSVEVSGFSS